MAKILLNRFMGSLQLLETRIPGLTGITLKWLRGSVGVVDRAYLLFLGCVDGLRQCFHRSVLIV